MTAPVWARKILATEFAGTEPPTLTWWRTKSLHSSGHANHRKRHIHVSAGTSRSDARLVFLHEVAHLKGKHGHTVAFWTEAFRLYRKYRVRIDYALERECRYKARTLSGALAAGVRISPAEQARLKRRRLDRTMPPPP